MRVKYAVIFLLKNFIDMVHTQFNKKIHVFRSNNGPEFFNQHCANLFQSLGIIHQSSCPYTPQQDGVVERRHRHILETARTIKFQGCLLDRFWGICIEVVVYIIKVFHLLF